MKKTVVGFLTAGVILSAGALSVFAAGPGSNFTDANADGVCDFAESTSASTEAVYTPLSQASTATAETTESTAPMRNYVDADNDGVCDNYAGRSCPQDGTGNQYGGHHGRNR